MATESRVSAVELRWYLAALLATVYSISWRAIGGHAPPAQPARAPTEPAHLVWIDRGPSAGPAIEPAAATTPVVRAPNRHVPRVRTRSS